MPELTVTPEMAESIARRTDELFQQQRQLNYRKTDRLFGALLLCEWMAGVGVALLVSPQTWSGVYSNVHVHVWMAVGLGALIVACPVFLAFTRPGETATRHFIAVGQMLYSALLIHLTGGRIESHFHVFGSLAFLSFYRDWRVLVTASSVVAIDHLARGLFFPQSVYGVAVIQPWRWVEHAWWVVFEDVFLIKACRDQVDEMRSTARRQAEVEETRAHVEELAEIRAAELKVSEKRLQEQFAENEQLANIVQSANEPIIGQTLDGIITSWNQGAERVFGYKAADVINKDIAMLVPNDRQSELADFLEKARNGSPIQSHETVRLRKNGSAVTVLVTRSPIIDANRQVVGISELMHNISERKEAEKRVSEFYSMVSHELRTPLTSIRGALGLIESGVTHPEETTDLIQVARGSADRLIRLINDMLDLKKIESGKMELRRSEFDGEELVTQVIYALHGMAQEAKVELVTEFEQPGTIYADWDKTTQVLTNLVSNAIKFSAGGQVKIKVDRGSQNRVRFTVIDHGPGIASADMPKLFGKFSQIDSSDSRQKGGTGLGLAISKALVERHGGAIGLDSDIGRGSSFWFEMPAAVKDHQGDQDAGTEHNENNLLPSESAGKIH